MKGLFLFQKAIMSGKSNDALKVSQTFELMSRRS